MPIETAISVEPATQMWLRLASEQVVASTILPSAAIITLTPRRKLDVDDDHQSRACPAPCAGRIEAGIHAAIRVESCHARLAPLSMQRPATTILAVTLAGDAVTLVAVCRRRHLRDAGSAGKVAIAGVANHDDNTTQKEYQPARFLHVHLVLAWRFTGAAAKLNGKHQCPQSGSTLAVRRRAPLS